MDEYKKMTKFVMVFILLAPFFIIMNWSHVSMSISQEKREQLNLSDQKGGSDHGNIICQRVPHLTPEQKHLCQHAPEALQVIRRGIKIAFEECHRLFWWMKDIHGAWNCTLYEKNLSANRLYLNVSSSEIQGTKEASLVQSLVSSGVAYALSEACTQDNFSYCTCGNWFDNQHYIESIGPVPLIALNQTIKASWEWNGCSRNLDFGAEVARLFLDSPEYYKVSPYSLVNLHNNQVGRRVLREEVVNHCQCHGYGGSCTVRTCWKKMNSFTNVAQTLYSRYVQARMVSYAWLFQEFRDKYSKMHDENGKVSGKLIAKLEHLRLVKESTIEDPEHKTFHHTFFNQPNILSTEGDKAIFAKVNKKNKYPIRRKDLLFVKHQGEHCQFLDLALKRGSILCLHDNGTKSNEERVFNLPQLKREKNRSIPKSIDLDLASQAGTCTNLCCERGFKERVTYRTEPCECKFVFCCRVICKRKCKVPVVDFECL